MEFIIIVMKELQSSSSRKFFSMDNDILPLFIKKYSHLNLNDSCRKEIENLLLNHPNFQQHSTKPDSFSLKKSQHACSKSDRKALRKRKATSLWCHQCKQKHNDILYCSKFYSGSCTKKYCKGCIERHYGQNFSGISKDNWICLFCRNLCVCAFCRRKRGEEIPKKGVKRKNNSEIIYTPPKKKKSMDKILETKILETKLYSTTPPYFFENPKGPNSFIGNCFEFDNSKNGVLHPFGISLKHLLDQNLINFGDKLMIQNTCFTGEVLITGDIKLEWNSYIVPSIVSFVESCGICYSDDWLDKVFCNGVKFRNYLELYYHQLNQTNYFLNAYSLFGNDINFDPINGDGLSEFTVDAINQMNNNHAVFSGSYDQKISLTDYYFPFSGYNQIIFYENKL